MVKKKKRKEFGFLVSGDNPILKENIIIEISSHSRAKCKKCEKVITKGVMRFLFFGSL